MEGMARAFATSFCGVDFRWRKARRASRRGCADGGRARAYRDRRPRGCRLCARNALASFVGAPVAGDGGELAHDEAFDVGPRGFVIVAAGAVVADLRVGEDDDLAGIGGVGEDFLVAGERGIEDDLAGALGGRTKAPALEDGAVFQGEDCRVQFRLFLRGVGQLSF